MASAPNHMMDASWFPASHPFLFFSPSLPILFFSFLHYLQLYMSLFGNWRGVERSLTQLPYHCMGVSSVFPSWQWHYIHTDKILSKLLFFLSPFFFFPSLPFPVLSPVVFTSSPLSPRAFCKPWLQSKRLGFSKANSERPVPQPHLWIVWVGNNWSLASSAPFSFQPPWDLQDARMPLSDGCSVLEQWLGCFL